MTEMRRQDAVVVPEPPDGAEQPIPEPDQEILVEDHIVRSVN